MLARTAAVYDPAKHEALIVIGHPKNNAPAYGWVAGLSFDEKNNSLSAEPEQIAPTLAEDVKAGRYKKISASFYLPDSPANPKPGTYYLRHVAFLGAQPPAVKGMRPVQFADNDADILTVEFGEDSIKPWVVGGIARLLNNLRDWIIDSSGLEKANEVIPTGDIDMITKEEARLNEQRKEQPNT